MSKFPELDLKGVRRIPFAERETKVDAGMFGKTDLDDDSFAQFFRGLPDILVAHQCLTPLDLERTFGMTGGDICHGRLEPDQLFSLRPHPEAAQYATPVKGLYLCGSGSHPGGGVTGAPGRNAAKRILKDL